MISSHVKIFTRKKCHRCYGYIINQWNGLEFHGFLYNKLIEHYMAAWRYEISLLVLKIFHLFAALTCEIFFNIFLEEKFRISARPFNFLYIFVDWLVTVIDKNQIGLESPIFFPFEAELASGTSGDLLSGRTKDLLKGAWHRDRKWHESRYLIALMVVFPIDLSTCSTPEYPVVTYKFVGSISIKQVKCYGYVYWV